MFPSLIKSSSGSPILVIARDFDHEPQVGLDHLLAGFFVAFLDARRKLDFLLRRQEFDLPDFAQIKFDRRVAVVGRAFPVG